MDSGPKPGDSAPYHPLLPPVPHDGQEAYGYREAAQPCGYRGAVSGVCVSGECVTENGYITDVFSLSIRLSSLEISGKTIFLPHV